MANNIQYSNAFGATIISTTEQADGSHALNVVMAQLPMRDISVYYAAPVSGSTNMAVAGGAITSTGTVSTAITPSAANFTRFRRTRVTGSATAGNSGANQMGYTRWFRGANGGFDACILFGIGSDATGFQCFIGFSTLVAALAGDASALTNCFGVGFDAADAAGGTWFLINNDGSGTATRTAIPGMTRSTTTGYCMRIICAAGASSSISVTITDAHSGAVVLASTTVSTDLPAVDTAMSFGASLRNGAVASSGIMDVSRIYITSSY